MKERIDQLKTIITQRVNYYSNIGFFNLANEFSNVLNILNEMENMAQQLDEKAARFQPMEDLIQNKSEEPAPAQEANNGKS